MTPRHFTRRPPRKSDGFAFGRFTAESGESVTYRLFRRDHNRRTHVETRVFFTDTQRQVIAMNLWRARIELRDRVDMLFFVSQGMVA